MNVSIGDNLCERYLTTKDTKDTKVRAKRHEPFVLFVVFVVKSPV
jgi:hypothetical protein